jgi:hypothetical protein
VGAGRRRRLRGAGARNRSWVGARGYRGSEGRLRGGAGQLGPGRVRGLSLVAVQRAVLVLDLDRLQRAAVRGLLDRLALADEVVRSVLAHPHAGLQHLEDLGADDRAGVGDGAAVDDEHPGDLTAVAHASSLPLVTDAADQFPDGS